MDLVWKFVDHLLEMAAHHRVVVLAAVGMGLARTIHGWQLGMGRVSGTPVDAHLMIDIGEIAVFVALAALVVRRGPLCRRSWPLVAGTACLVVALCAAHPPFDTWAMGSVGAVGNVCAGVAYALLLLVWLELCGCIAPLQATVALVSSYAVSLVGWMLLRSVAGVAGYAVTVVLCLVCALLVVGAYRAIPLGALPQSRSVHNTRRALSVPVLLWMALMAFTYGFGDCFTQMGFSTMASKVGMVVPLVVVGVALAWVHDGVDIRMVYRMSLVLMALGVVPAVLFDVLPSVSQVLMSAAQAGNMVVACVIACTSAHRRHESSIFGCGVLMAISLAATLLGNAAGELFTQVCFALSEPMARVAGTAIVLMVVLAAAYLMHDEDLSSLVTDRPQRLAPSEAAAPAPTAREVALPPRRTARLAQACAQLGRISESAGVGACMERCAKVAEAAGLSKRETAVFALMVDGKNVAVIGEELFIAQGTVRAHMSRIYEKLGVHSREEFGRLFAPDV